MAGPQPAAGDQPDLVVGATALGGFASSFAMLALARLGVGIGEAASQPAGTSLIYDYWPKERRGFVMSVLASAIALGIGGSLILGGLAADWWSDDLSRRAACSGWQFAFFVASHPGFVLAVLIWLLREPVRGGMDGIVTPPDPPRSAPRAQVLPRSRRGSTGSVWTGWARPQRCGATTCCGWRGSCCRDDRPGQADPAISPRPPLALRCAQHRSARAAMERDRLWRCSCWST